MRGTIMLYLAQKYYFFSFFGYNRKIIVRLYLLTKIDYFYEYRDILK